MIEIKGNLFNEACDAFCITTNGFRKSDGSCVMGRGCAKQMLERMPSIASRLGKLIEKWGNRAMCIGVMDGKTIVSYPVKPVFEICNAARSNAVQHMQGKFKEGDSIPGWACVADTAIIVKSAHELVAMANKFGWQTVMIPRPGCGAGELGWDTVKPLLEVILDDRFIAITF